MPKDKLSVMVLGLRGLQGIQGGVEAHASNLYPLLVDRGCKVEAIVRSPFYNKTEPRHWQGIRLRVLWSPQTSGLEAFIHTFIGILYAAIKRPDILHIHAVGPMIMTPLARLFGLRVVVTHHGSDYDREKWGRFARWILRTGESLGVRYAGVCIVVSDVMRKLIKDKYKTEAVFIPNGVRIPQLLRTNNVLQKFKLEPLNYVLQVSRFVPEKRQVDLIRAFERSKLANWKLVLVGTICEEEKYSKEIISYSKNNKNIVLTDFQTGSSLQELYSNAGLFVLPSSHEGLPIALLEALSYGLKAFASDIPANIEIGLSPESYFALGDINQLAELLNKESSLEYTDEERNEVREWVKIRYNWDNIAEQTLTIYKQVLSSKRPA